MKERRKKSASELRRVACEICDAPYTLIQKLNIPNCGPGPAYGAYKATCSCVRPAPATRRAFGMTTFLFDDDKRHQRSFQLYSLEKMTNG